MTEVSVTAEGGNEYRVTVAEPGSESEHRVTATPAEVERFGEGTGAEALIEASFRFLLEREPKESILRRFELPVIARYFPEYPDRISEYL